MARKIFVNIAVKDLKKNIEFFGKLGFEFNPQFTDENAACMIVNEDAYVMLLVENRFQEFTKKKLTDSTQQTEAILAISVDSRAQVDALIKTALAEGGKPSNEPMDHGFMYMRSFQDLDGHLWEVLWMDPGAVTR